MRNDKYIIESMIFTLYCMNKSIRLDIKKDKWITDGDGYINNINLPLLTIYKKLELSRIDISIKDIYFDIYGSDLDVSLDNADLTKDIATDYNLIKFSSLSRIDQCLTFYSESIPTNDIPIRVKGFCLILDY